MWHALPPCPPDGCDEAGGEAVLCKTQQQAALAHACSSGRGREEMRLERGLWAAGSDASSQATAPTAVADEQQLYQVVIVLPLGHPASAMRECGQGCDGGRRRRRRQVAALRRARLQRWPTFTPPRHAAIGARRSCLGRSSRAPPTKWAPDSSAAAGTLRAPLTMIWCSTRRAGGAGGSVQLARLQ